MTLVPGTRIGPFEVLGPLGAGGMGEVYKARDTRLGRDVAIKALPEAFARDPERLARFEREARLLASLNHPNIAGIHGIEVVEGLRYLVLEFVDGPTLADRLAKGPLPLDDTLEIGRQIAAGVEAAHESGIVHRDLKPGNVKITPDGQVKVLDFGLARGGAGAGGSGSDLNLSASPTMTYAAVTGAGIILGTAAYMSPEQARGRAVDRRTDIWSFGCVLYECLTGRSAFAGETVSDLIAKIIEREPDWSALPASTPPRLRELLRRCLRKDAKERLRDIGDARVELGEILAGDAGNSGAFAGADTAAAPAAPARWKAVPFAWGIIATAALAAILGGLATVRFLVKPKPAPALALSFPAPDGVQLSVDAPEIVISPDGTGAVFSGLDSTGMPRIWHRSLASAAGMKAVPGTEGGHLPFWSPDSRSIAFFADGKLKRTSVAGGPVQVICNAPSGRGGAWGAGDAIILAPAPSGPLMRVPASGGEPAPATTLDAAAGETAHRFPSFLPDGRHFLYAALPGTDAGLSTRLGRLESLEPGPVLVTADCGAVHAEPGYLIYSSRGGVLAMPFNPDTRRVTGAPRSLPGPSASVGQYAGEPLLTASRNGLLLQREIPTNVSRLELTDLPTGTTRTVPVAEALYTSLRLSPDGSRVVLEGRRESASEGQVVVADLTRGVLTPIGPKTPTSTAGIWTRDGVDVIYAASPPAGDRGLYRRRADASGPEQLISSLPSQFSEPRDVTPDGRQVVYRLLSGATNEDLWICSIDGPPDPRPLFETRANEGAGSISPDGRWIATRSDESGRFEIYVQAFPGLERRVQVSVDGGVPWPSGILDWIRWREDGRGLFYVSPDARTIMTVDIDPAGGLHVGRPRAHFRLPAGCVEADISADGRTVLASVARGGEGRALINVFVNWDQALRDQP